MKKLIFTLFAIISFVTKGVVVEFPDDNFKAAILSQSPEIDANGDGEIEDIEAEAYTGDFTFQGLAIADLTGLEAFINLNYLTIQSCANITELDVSANTALQGLTCSNTAITTLDLSNKTFTQDVSVTFNVSLTSINLMNSNMQEASFNNCGLVDGDFTYTNIESLILFNNYFIELDFGTAIIGELGLFGNNELTYLNLNNGVAEEFMEFSIFGGAITGDLTFPNLESICVEEIGNETQLLLEELLTIPTTFIDDCFFNGNTYYGTVSFDIDGDGCDGDDLGANVFINASNDSYNTTVSSDNLGTYNVNIYNDVVSPYTISVIGLPDYFSVSPEEIVSDFDTVGNEEELNFCIEATEDIDDVNITIVSINPAIPGFPASYQLIYQNYGTNSSSGGLSLTYDNTKMSFTSASEVMSDETGNTLYFDYSDLMPLETRFIELEFLVEVPPTTAIDDVLDFLAVINPEETDATPEDNEYVYSEVVIGSFDPNDVTVMEGDWLAIDDVNNYLHYRIRFQNTGTAAAVNVRVENELDDLLDWSTLQLLNTSHDSRLEIEGENELVFYFDNINLIDSLTDEANSHGYIIYKIKPKEEIAIDDVIENQAAIYFDFNEPVITNIATIAVVLKIPTISVPELTTLEYTIYPVPTTAILNINSGSSIVKVEVVNELGQLLISEKNTNRIDVSELSKGLYFVKVVDEMGHSGVQKIIR